MKHLVISSCNREKRYEQRRRGSYILFFRHNSKKLAIDATEDDGSYGRLINHSSRAPNVGMKIFVVEQRPTIVFVALREIKVGQEIQYDYGEKRKDILESNRVYFYWREIANNTELGFLHQNVANQLKKLGSYA